MRAHSSGALSATTLRDEAMTQMTKEWLGAPLPVGPVGNVSADESNSDVIASRFGVAQVAK